MRLPQGFISFSPSLPIFLQLTSPAEGYRQGDRRVSERSTLPFISPSPVSSGLTSLLSLSLSIPTSCLWWPHVARSREKGQPCPDLLFTLVDLRAYYTPTWPSYAGTRPTPETVVHALLLFCLPSARPWIKGRLSCLSSWVTYFFIF